MKVLKSCGIVLLRKTDPVSVLLLKNRSRYDLPKGHIESDETEWQCATREFMEETSLPIESIQKIEDFRFEITYTTRYRRFNNATVLKDVVIFAAWQTYPKEIQLSEHCDYQWLPWNLACTIDHGTITPLIQQLGCYFD